MATILIADDDELVIEVVRQALEPRGHFVGAVDDGVPVLGLVEGRHPALVILDCGLPEVSGIEALCQIRGSNTCYDTPVLMLTGRRGEADEAIAMRAGANEYLRKPFDPDDLIVRVEHLIDLAKARDASASAPSPEPLPQREPVWGHR